jgi:hypothetical protein
MVEVHIRGLLQPSDQLQASAALPPGRESSVLIEWAAEALSPTWRSEDPLACRDSNSDPSVVEHVASSYTDCAAVVPVRKAHDHVSSVYDGVAVGVSFCWRGWVHAPRIGHCSRHDFISRSLGRLCVPCSGGEEGGLVALLPSVGKYVRRSGAHFMLFVESDRKPTAIHKRVWAIVLGRNVCSVMIRG